MSGRGRWLPILETTAEGAAQMIAVPYLAAFNLARDLVPGMIKLATQPGQPRTMPKQAASLRTLSADEVGMAVARAAATNPGKL
jgi:NAD(P)-dependent dehydrogenase (short-subunit alcohol dehydrogenase family)